jgi:hypothetical protein
VRFKRKADDYNQLLDLKNNPREYKTLFQQCYRNNEMLAQAEQKVLTEDAAAKKKVGNAQEKAIKLVADADAAKKRAEAKKTEAETKLLEFDLEQKQKAAGLDTAAKKSETVEEKEPKKQKKPQTPEQMEYNRKRREKYAIDKARNKQNAAEDL